MLLKNTQQPWQLPMVPVGRMDGDLKETEILRSVGLNKNGVLMAWGRFLGRQLFSSQFLTHTLSLVPEAHKKP